VANFANQVGKFSVSQINFKLSHCFLYIHVHNCNVIDLTLNLHPWIVMIVLNFKSVILNVNHPLFELQCLDVIGMQLEHNCAVINKSSSYLFNIVEISDNI